MRSDLICPHCGGPFQLDDQRTLQADWHCPYCKQISHFKIKQGHLSLESVIRESSQKADPLLAQKADESVKTDSILAESISPDKSISADNQENTGQTVATNNKIREPMKSAKVDQHLSADHAFKSSAALAEEAFQAYKNHNIPLFNVLVRKLLDIDPLDKRVYSWRALLREFADGFSRCWADPVWLDRAKSQRQALLRQHFHDLSIALRLGNEDEQKALTEEISHLIADQICRIFHEIATERRAQKRRHKFNGRYKKKDLTFGLSLKITWQEWPVAIPEVLETDLPDACRRALRQKEPGLYQALTKYNFL